MRAALGQGLADTALQMADKLDRSMDARINEVKLLLGVQALSERLDPLPLRSQLEQLQHGYEVASWIGVTDATGVVLVATGGILEGVDIGHRPVFQNGRHGLWIGDVHEAVLLASLLPNPSGEPIKFVDIAAPLHDAAGGLVGVLAVHLSWEWATHVQASMFSPLTDTHGLELFVLAQDGTILLGPSAMIGQTIDPSPFSALTERGASWTVALWSDGETYLTGIAPSVGVGSFEGLGWSVVARKPVETAFAPVQELQAKIAGIGILLAALFALAGWALATRLAAPLTRLAVAADQINDGSEAESIPQETATPELARLSASLRAMLERLRHQDRTITHLTDIAHTDPLTGLPNRPFLEQHLAHALPEAEREGRALALLFLDLDGFKQVNDTLGHHAGDLLLMECANRLRHCLRGGDVAARLGGDEFVIVARAHSDKILWLAQTLGERLVRALSEPVTLPGIGVARVGCSVGVALWPHHGKTAQDVLALADTALYGAKHAGKGQVVVYTPAPEETLAAPRGA